MSNKTFAIAVVLIVATLPVIGLAYDARGEAESQRQSETVEQFSTAMVVVNPGETTPPLQATGCEFTDGFGLPGSGGPGCALCGSNCNDFDTNTANARLFFVVPGVGQPGRRYAQSSPWVDFEISASPETEGNLIPCSINYEAEWFGEWFLFGVLTGGAEAEVKTDFYLEDLTEGGIRVKSEAVHSLKPEGLGVDIFEGGIWINNDGRRDSFMAMCKRGHTYRLKFTLTLKTRSFANMWYFIDYQTGGWGAWWNHLSVSLPEDPEDLVQELREEFEAHKHVYLTGHGVGHNNTEAETEKPIVPDDGPGDGSATTVPSPLSPVGQTFANPPTLHWLPTDDASSYDVELQSLASNEVTATEAIASTSFVPSKLKRKDPYRWRVRARTIDGAGPWSDWIGFHFWPFGGNAR